MKTQQIKDTAFLALCMVLSIIGLLVVVKDVGFIITQEKVSAQILQTNAVLDDKAQNKIIIRYFNKYQNGLIETYLDDLDYDYINNIKQQNYSSITICHGYWFPQVVYRTEDKPAWGHVIIGLIFFLIFLAGSYITYYNIRNWQAKSNIKVAP